MAAGGNVGLREVVLHGREQSMFIYRRHRSRRQGEADGAGEKGGGDGGVDPEDLRKRGRAGVSGTRPQWEEEGGQSPGGVVCYMGCWKGPSCPMCFYFLKQVRESGQGCGRWRGEGV